MIFFYFFHMNSCKKISFSKGLTKRGYENANAQSPYNEIVAVHLDNYKIHNYIMVLDLVQIELVKLSPQ